VSHGQSDNSDASAQSREKESAEKLAKHADSDDLFGRENDEQFASDNEGSEFFRSGRLAKDKEDSDDKFSAARKKGKKTNDKKKKHKFIYEFVYESDDFESDKSEFENSDKKAAREHLSKNLKDAARKATGDTHLNKKAFRDDDDRHGKKSSKADFLDTDEDDFQAADSQSSHASADVDSDAENSKEDDDDNTSEDERKASSRKSDDDDESAASARKIRKEVRRCRR